VALSLSQRTRLLIGTLLGAAGGTIAAALSPWQLAVLVAWDLAAGFIAGSIWAFVPVLDSDATRAAAGREDLSTTSDDVTIFVASVISLAGVLLTLVAANDDTGALKATMIGVAVLTVVISWMTVHTVFILRYGNLYYDGVEGGIDFHGGGRPDYLDFAYPLPHRRDDVPGLGHRHLGPHDPPDGHPTRAPRLRVRHSDHRRDDQRRRRPPRHVVGRTPDQPASTTRSRRRRPNFDHAQVNVPRVAH